MRKYQKVAVIGAGPAGATAATLLARNGVDVAIFDTGKRPPLLVGESLVPAIIPILQRLGVEEEVKGYSMLKPGATFFPTSGEELTYPFNRTRGDLPPYAYNCPRDCFDQTLLDNAIRAGAKRFETRAELETGKAADSVELSAETLAATDGFFTEQPDLIIDATGRSRQIPRLLGIPSREGERKDVALFAHLEGAGVPREGNIHIDRLRQGWCWRIPLPGKLSLGIVIDQKHLERHGKTSEEQYDSLRQSDPILKQLAGDAKRITPVLRYTNYQMVSDRAVGANWALVGDSSGFIDPIFSSGLFIAMDGAERLANAVLRDNPLALKEYERYTIRHLASWHEIVGYFYSGRLLTLLRFGREMQSTLIGRLIDPHMQKHMGRIFTGAAATARYSLGLLRFMTTYGIARRDHRLLKIN